MLYIHFPFCKKRCAYCDFYSTCSIEKSDMYVDALCKELEIRAQEIERLTTIYFGGGTPSQMNYVQLKKILDKIEHLFDCSQLVETTIECNPDDLTPEWLEAISTLPINRMSIGIQSFDDQELQLLNRRHSAQEAVDAVKLAQKFGFKNISIDLMYGLPNQSFETWKNNVEKAINLDIQHISAYSLSYEEGTKLMNMLKRGEIEEQADEDYEMFYFELIKKLSKAGFIQYELSNFAKNSYESKHNSAYWKAVPYLGVGASAHSYDGEHCRSFVTPDIDLYIKSITEKSIVPIEKEILSEDDRFNELIMVSLRTMKGVSIEQLERSYQSQYLQSIDAIQSLLANRMLIVEGEYLKLTPQAYFVSDNIISSLFV